MSLAKYRLSLLTLAAAATLAASPAAQAGKPSPKPLKAKLECKIVFAPGASAKVRFESESAYERRFTASVESAYDGEVGSDEDVALYQDGDVLPVSIGSAPAIDIGAIELAQDGEQLEGSLDFRYRARKGRSLDTFPANFPALAAGTPVTIDGRTCTLQDRNRGKRANPRGR